MSVRWNQWTGHYSQVAESLRRALGQYMTRNSEFKVGLTVDPDQRWGGHAPDGWREMVVIYETSSARSAAQAERELIEHGWESQIDSESWNLVRGGGGLQQGYDAYYVYVLLW